MTLLYIVTFLLLTVSFIKNREKTIAALKIGNKKLLVVLPVFIVMIVFVSLLQGFVSDELISEYLGKSSGIRGIFTALFFGSITLMPGFIVFPLSGILLNKGAFYMIIAMFTNSTMLVGVLTFPVEKKFLGMKVGIIRNIAALFISLITGLVTGYMYGEL